MNCTDIQQHIDDYLDLALNTFDSQAFDDHLRHCSTCNNKIEQARKLQHALHNLPIRQADDNFEQRVLDKVHKHYQPKSSNRFLAGFATSMAASLALWFGVSVYQPEIKEQQAATIDIALQKSRTVNLKFNAPENLDQVTLSIELPDHVELSSYPGQRSLSWKTKLNKGSNVLSLPVIAIGSGEGELVARIQYGNKSKHFSIILNSKLNGVWQIKPINIPAA